MKILSLVFFFSILFSIHRKPEVGIVAYGYKPSDTAISIIKKRIWEVYHLKAKYLGEDCMPTTPDEGSYVYAKAFHMGKYKTRKYTNIVGITDRGLFADVFTFEPIYGYSYINDCGKDNNTSIITTRRWFGLNDTTSANVVAHELGHQLKMNHCFDEKCLMYSTGNIEDSTLCKRCARIYKHIKL